MLDYIKIQNFKSLKDVTLNLKQINLLIGANNSGKSNLLKALEFIGKIIFSKGKVLSNQSEYNRLVFNHLNNENIYITVQSHDVKLSFYITLIFIEINFPQKQAAQGLSAYKPAQ
jgi:AAA15 family ATPase/GTPase